MKAVSKGDVYNRNNHTHRWAGRRGGSVGNLLTLLKPIYIHVYHTRYKYRSWVRISVKSHGLGLFLKEILGKRLSFRCGTAVQQQYLNGVRLTRRQENPSRDKKQNKSGQASTAEGGWGGRKRNKTKLLLLCGPTFLLCDQ